MNITELTVTPNLPFDITQTVHHRFTDIDDRPEDTYAAGWVSSQDQFDTNNLALILGDYVVMALRIDERKVPAAVLKKFVAKEERRICREKQIPRISRRQRTEIRERIHTEMIRKAKPTTTVAEVIWNVTDGRIFLLNTSQGIIDTFQGLFQATFGVLPAEPEPVDGIDDFLTWCWWRSEVIDLDGRMTLGDSPEQVSCTPGPEAFRALALGKQINQAGIRVGEHGTCVLIPGIMRFKSVRLPAARTDTVDDGAVLERIHLMVTLIDVVQEEVRIFKGTDLTPMRSWVYEQNEVVV